MSFKIWMNRDFWIVAIAPGAVREYIIGHVFNKRFKNHTIPQLLSRTRLLFYQCPSVCKFSFQWKGGTQSFERKHAGQAGDRFGRSAGFGGKQILEVLVLGRHKRFAADDAGIREIPDGDTESLKETHIFTYVPQKYTHFLYRILKTPLLPQA